MDRIKDIIEAGTLEIECAFIDFETKMKVIDEKSWIINCKYNFNWDKFKLTDIFCRGRISKKIDEELLTYINNL